MRMPGSWKGTRYRWEVHLVKDQCSDGSVNQEVEPFDNAATEAAQQDALVELLLGR
ncbi:MAG: hypothetical protein Q4F10_11380 [Corynebacterium glutamicum]|nr:hypothetical protein [Corynebacterium glutamicum]